MQILLALIVGAAIGWGAHALVPGRDARGVAVGPMLGALVAAAAWLILTWAGFGLDNPWLWIVPPVVPAVVVAPVLLLLTRRRLRRDAAEQRRLGLV